MYVTRNEGDNADQQRKDLHVMPGPRDVTIRVVFESEEWCSYLLYDNSWPTLAGDVPAGLKCRARVISVTTHHFCTFHITVSVKIRGMVCHGKTTTPDLKSQS